MLRSWLRLWHSLDATRWTSSWNSPRRCWRYGPPQSWWYALITFSWNFQRALVGATLRLLTLRSGESHALPATLLALFWNTPGRSSCYALLFFLKHSSMRLMLRSDFQHVLDARLLGFLGPSTRSLGIARLGFSWNFQHAFGATLLTSSWNCQRSLDASLLCYAFSLGTSNRLLMLRTKLPHVLNATRSILFHWTSWAFSWNTPALCSFGFGKRIRRFCILLQLNDWSFPQGFSTEVAKTGHTMLIIIPLHSTLYIST